MLTDQTSFYFKGFIKDSLNNVKHTSHYSVNYAHGKY